MTLMEETPIRSSLSPGERLGHYVLSRLSLNPEKMEPPLTDQQVQALGTALEVARVEQGLGPSAIDWSEDECRQMVESIWTAISRETFAEN